MYKILHSYCLIDISEFPFDTQKCKIMIGSWSYDESTLDLRIYAEDKGMDLSLYEKNVVWELKSTHAQRHTERYSCCPWLFVDLTYTLEFRRIPLYYLMTLVYPTMLLSFLSCVSFLFPADSGERVSLVISVLLGLIVFMLIVNDRTPVTSKETPLITKYFNSIAGVHDPRSHVHSFYTSPKPRARRNIETSPRLPGKNPGLLGHRTLDETQHTKAPGWRQCARFCAVQYSCSKDDEQPGSRWS